MHHLPTQHAVIRFRLAALLLLIKWLLFTGSAAVLAYSAWLGSRPLAQVAVGMVGLVVPVMFAQWLSATRARCPLCIGHPLAHRACATHRDTRRLFGSYRARVAMTVIFRGRFRCPYCGESAAVAVRQR